VQAIAAAGEGQGAAVEGQFGAVEKSTRSCRSADQVVLVFLLYVWRWDSLPSTRTTTSASERKRAERCSVRRGPPLPVDGSAGWKELPVAAGVTHIRSVRKAKGFQEVDRQKRVNERTMTMSRAMATAAEERWDGSASFFGRSEKRARF
jgi:hypothetical protein